MGKKREILALPTRAELAEAVDQFELEPEDRRKKDALVDTLARSKKARLDLILEPLLRDRLKQLCVQEPSEAGNGAP